MRTILLIRHGMTAGNMEKRYIGRTDQPLCDIGAAQAKALAPCLPRCDFLFSSPLLRCRQTAAMLFPGQTACVIPELRECDFGIFEGKDAAALAGNPAYDNWLATNCTAPIPEGEDVSAFKARCAKAFAHTAFRLPKNSVAAFVLHGGCIMAILERFARPRGKFYDFHLGNCRYVACCCENRTLTTIGGSLC